MPRLSKEIKEHIKALPKETLEKIVIKLASKDKWAYNFIEINYLNKETGEQELFEQTKNELSALFYKAYKGRSEQIRFTKTMAAGIKKINEFTKISKNKYLEAQLLIFLLESVPFSMPSNMFGTCFTSYDTKTAIILKRLINLVSKKLHHDYFIEFEEKINSFLKSLHETSNHIDTVYKLPQKITQHS